MKKPLLKIAAMAVLLMAAMTTGHAQDIPITLEPGWNWMSYPYSEPMTIQEALSGFIPANGDIIQSQSNGNATYRNGRWMGQLTTLIPGEGYIYMSADGTTRSFIFGGAGTANDASALPEEALPGEFTVAANGTKVRFSPGNLQCRINPNKEVQATMGTETSTNIHMPYNTNYNYSICQMIYKAKELSNAGLIAGPITSIEFESHSNNHYRRDNIRIWMAATTLTEAPSTSVITSGMTQVFNGSVIQQDGWTPISFSTPFVWDGASNVMVTVVMNHGSYNSSTYWLRSNADFTCCSYTRRDSNSYDPSSATYSMLTVSYRPNTRFNGKNGLIWRFAEKQWDYIGDGNSHVSSSYTGWFDLFGWGTSGHTHGANCWQPWSTSGEDSDYYAYGSESYNLYDQTGEADWGCNPISNGGNKPTQWRTLSNDEWNYLCNTRSTSSGKRYAKAKVNGVCGVILLPDNWNTSYFSLNSTNSTSAGFTSNTITDTQWMTLEQHGAVFLPVAGYRVGTNCYGIANGFGAYWTNQLGSNNHPYRRMFNNSTFSYTTWERGTCQSVRLVCQTNPRVRTISVTNVSSTGHATINAEVDCTGSSTVNSRGICYCPNYISSFPTIYNGYKSSGTGKGSYSVQLGGLLPNCTYCVRAWANIAGSYRYGNVISFTTPDDGSNGHESVDLGLPNGLLWASYNVGVTSPESSGNYGEYGNYYAWGEITPKSSYDWSNYQHCNGSSTTITKYCDKSSEGYEGFVDNITTLLPEDDPATANWGGDWRTPTVHEWQVLLDNTTHYYATSGGVLGIMFIGSNGNWIFLPAAGDYYGSSNTVAGTAGSYWANSLHPDYSSNASCYKFDSNNQAYDQIIYPVRQMGRSVRAVRTPRRN